MNLPIICHGCGHQGKLARLTDDAVCPKCASVDIDFDDTAETSDGDWPLDAAFPNTPDPDWPIGGKNAVATGKSVIADIQDKLKEIAAGVIETNPSMDPAIAFQVAAKTISRYPKVAGITDDAIAMLNQGFEAGLVDASSVTWFAPTEAGQAVAREHVGEVPA